MLDSIIYIEDKTVLTSGLSGVHLVHVQFRSGVEGHTHPERPYLEPDTDIQQALEGLYRQSTGQGSKGAILASDNQFSRIYVSGVRAPSLLLLQLCLFVPDGVPAFPPFNPAPSSPPSPLTPSGFCFAAYEGLIVWTPGYVDPGSGRHYFEVYVSGATLDRNIVISNVKFSGYTNLGLSDLSDIQRTFFVASGDLLDVIPTRIRLWFASGVVVTSDQPSDLSACVDFVDP